MMSSIQSMMERYQPQNAEAYRNALKEIVQEIALHGMSKSGFFQEGAFYGGTALRIFYGLHRFSEDMDFSLVHPNPSFALSDYLPAVEEELSAVGLKMRVEQKNKTKVTDIQSAFIKGGTLIQIISIQQTDEVLIPGIHKQEQLKIKLEVDTNPPPGAGFELRYALRPVPYVVRLYDKPSLFAGKIHAVLCRNWARRIKGRDLYDYVWYLSQDTPVNLFHLQKRLEQSDRWDSSKQLALQDTKDMLKERFSQLDFEAAKKDVIPFLSDASELDLWNAGFFQAITENLTANMPRKQDRTR